jgi:hypothetical protein
MILAQRQQTLDSVLSAFGPLWHAQPFREIRPDWCKQWPALTSELLALDDGEQARLADDGEAAAGFVARHVGDLAVLPSLAYVAACPASALPDHGPFWAHGIPGRKRAQIEAFAASVARSGQPVVDWCGGKGHLGRLLALHWLVGVTTLEIDRALCVGGEHLARRAGVAQCFVAADATLPETPLQRGGHAVALHACGHLHRALVARAAGQGLAALDLAPCCYHLGIAREYLPLSGPLQTRLSTDDVRLAVTESVTAAPRQARQRDREMAWKLGFDAWRRLESGIDDYLNFRPVPAAWARGSFAEFMALMCGRERIQAPAVQRMAMLERRGWERQREVMRLSILRHAFRRPLEVWLALDLAVRLENDGYSVGLGQFCERRLTPRNLLISARLN